MRKLMLMIILPIMICTMTSCFQENVLVAGGKTKITFWHAIGPTGNQFFNKIIESFEETYPMFEVEEIFQGGYTDLRDKILYSVSVGEGPTIAQGRPEDIGSYLGKGLIKNLDDYINNQQPFSSMVNYLDNPKWQSNLPIGLGEDDKNDFVSAFYEEGALYGDKKMYSLPYLKSTEVLFYNKDFFEEYATELAEFGVQADGTWRNPTWDQVEGIAKFYATTAEYNALEASLKEVASGFSVDSEANLFITLTRQWGGKYTGFDANGKGQYLFNNAESKEAISWFAKNFEDGIFGTAQKFGTDYSSDAFKAMQCIMTTGSSAGASYNTTENFKTGVAEYPQRADGQNKNVIQQGTNVCLFERDNALEELGGWLFMKWMTNYESGLVMVTNLGYLPIRKSVYLSDVYKNSLTNNYLYFEANKVGFSQYQLFYPLESFAMTSKVKEEVKSLVNEILNGNSIEEAYNKSIDNCEKL